LANIKETHIGNSQGGDEGRILNISYDKLSPDTLRAIIEEFVTREGTDYGEIEVPFEQKISQVQKELISGKVIILYDKKDQTCNIVSKDDPATKNVLGKDSDVH